MAGICTCWDENNFRCADCESEINSFEECCTEECGCNKDWELKIKRKEQPKWNQRMKSKFSNRSLQKADSNRNVRPICSLSHSCRNPFQVRRLNLVNLAARVLHPRDKYCERRHVSDMNTFQKLLDTPCSSLLSLNEINCSIKQTPTKKTIAKKNKGIKKLLFRAENNQEIDFWQKIGPNLEMLPFGVVPMERNKSQLKMQVWSPIFPETKNHDDPKSSQDENTFRKHNLVFKSAKSNTNFKKSSKIEIGKNKNKMFPLTKDSSNQTDVLPTLTLQNNKNNHHVEAKTFSETSKPSSLSPRSRTTRGCVKETDSFLSVICSSKSSFKPMVGKHVSPCVQLVDRSTSPLREVLCQCTPTTYISCPENTHTSPLREVVCQCSPTKYPSSSENTHTSPLREVVCQCTPTKYPSCPENTHTFPLREVVCQCTPTKYPSCPENTHTSPLREVVCQCTPTKYPSCPENTHTSPLREVVCQCTPTKYPSCSENTHNSPLREVVCHCTPTTYISCSENTHTSPFEFPLSQTSERFDKETPTIHNGNFPVNHRAKEPTSHLCLAALLEEDPSSHMLKSHQDNLHPEIQRGINMDTKFLKALNSSSTNYPELSNSFLTQPIEPCQVQSTDVSETARIFPRLAENQLEFENKNSAGTKIESSGKTGDYGGKIFLEHDVNAQEDVFREGYHVKTQPNLEKIDYYDIVDDSETLANVLGERSENYFNLSPKSMRDYSSLPSRYIRYFDRPKSAGYETLAIPVEKSNSVQFYDQSNNLKYCTSSCPSKLCIARSPKEDEIYERELKEFDFQNYKESDTGNISQRYRPIIKSESETNRFFKSTGVKSDFFENHESSLPESRFPSSIGTQTLTIMPKCDEKSIGAKSRKSSTEEVIRNNFKHTFTDDKSRARLFVRKEANLVDSIAQTEPNYYAQTNSSEKLEYSHIIKKHYTENKQYTSQTALTSSFKNKHITERMRRFSSLKYTILRNLILNRAASKIKSSALGAISQLNLTKTNANISCPIYRGFKYNFNHESSSIDKGNIAKDQYMAGRLDRASNVVEHLWNQNEGCLTTSFISRCAVLRLSLMREPSCCYFNKFAKGLNTSQQYKYEFDVNKLNNSDSEADGSSRINPIPLNGATPLRRKQRPNSSSTLAEIKSISGNLTTPAQKSVYTQVDFGFGKPFDGKESEIENISHDLSVPSGTTTNLGGLTMGRTSPVNIVGLNTTSSLPLLEFPILPRKEQSHVILGPVPAPVTPAHAVAYLKGTLREVEHRSDSSSENHSRRKRSLIKTTKRVFTWINPFTRSKMESNSS